MDPQFMGQVVLFAGNFAPRGWAFCEGQLLPIAQNTALFSLLGTTFGGDGRTTFALPDYKGRVAVGKGNGPGLTPIQQGEKLGANTTTLLTADLPASSITVGASSDDATSDEPGSKYFALTDAFKYHAATAGESMAVGHFQGAANTPVNNNAPSLGLNYIIALQGTYPSRS